MTSTSTSTSTALTSAARHATTPDTLAASIHVPSVMTDAAWENLRANVRTGKITDADRQAVASIVEGAGNVARSLDSWDKGAADLAAAVRNATRTATETRVRLAFAVALAIREGETTGAALASAWEATPAYVSKHRTAGRIMLAGGSERDALDVFKSYGTDARTGDAVLYGKGKGKGVSKALDAADKAGDDKAGKTIASAVRDLVSATSATPSNPEPKPKPEPTPTPDTGNVTVTRTPYGEIRAALDGLADAVRSHGAGLSDGERGKVRHALAGLAHEVEGTPKK